MNNTGYTGKSIPTPIYENKNKYIHCNMKDINNNNNNNLMFVSFFLFPIHGVFKIPCVPCVSTIISQSGGRSK